MKVICEPKESIEEGQGLNSRDQTVSILIINLNLNLLSLAASTTMEY